jgi:hypothetical protein
MASMTMAAEPMTQAAAEKLARAQWFEFELAPVQSSYGGDWVKFVAAKQAEESKFAAAWSSSSGSPRAPRPDSEAESRAQRVVQVEFQQVAQARTAEVKALAVKVLEGMKRGDLEAFVDDCSMYDAKAPSRRELTRTFFKEQRAAWMKAAKLADTAVATFAEELDFTRPSPPTGMTGKVTISFGPKGTGAPRPGLYPERHQLELTWSGEVMPEANGALFAAPASPRLERRWRFYRLVMPYSRNGNVHLE